MTLCFVNHFEDLIRGGRGEKEREAMIAIDSFKELYVTVNVDELGSVWEIPGNL